MRLACREDVLAAQLGNLGCRNALSRQHALVAAPKRCSKKIEINVTAMTKYYACLAAMTLLALIPNAQAGVEEQGPADWRTLWWFLRSHRRPFIFKMISMRYP
jgi:hypothetical protein